MATLDQIAAALRKADAAGNVEDARALANAYRQMQGQQQPPAQPQTAQQVADTLSLPIPGTEWNTPEQPARFQSPIPGGDMMNEFARSFAENIPIAGPLTTRAMDATGSQIAAMITGQSPEETLKIGQDLRARDAADQPVANVAGTVAGSVGPLMSLGTTKIGEQALGMTGPLWQRMLGGGVSGGLITGVDSLARGDDLGEAGGKALVGLGIGGASPVAERAIAPIIRMLTGQNSSTAVQNVSKNLEREGIDPADIMARIDAMGPDGVIADLGPNMQRQAGAIASLPGEGQTILRDALTTRAQGTNSRIQGDIDAALGPAPVPSYLQADIRAGQQALQPEYQRVLQGAAPVDPSALAQSLDDIAMRERGPAQRAAAQVRQMLDDAGAPGSLSNDPGTLLATRNAIDGLFEGEVNPKVIGVLTRARQQVDDMLTQAVPGIKDVDAKFAELGRQSTAVGDGRTILGSGPEAPVPREVADMVAAGAQPEGLLIGPSGATFRLTQGARAEIERIVGTTANNLTALKSALKGDGSWNRDRLATLFGQDKADRLLGVLEREKRYAETFDTVTRNSETAARTAAQKEAAPQQFGQTSTSLADLLLKIPQGLANRGASMRSEATNKAIAEMLTGRPTPELVDQLLLARQMNRGLIGSSAAPLLTN